LTALGDPPPPSPVVSPSLMTWLSAELEESLELEESIELVP
jgi:hypothetical protein